MGLTKTYARQKDSRDFLFNVCKFFLIKRFSKPKKRLLPTFITCTAMRVWEPDGVRMQQLSAGYISQPTRSGGVKPMTHSHEISDKTGSCSKSAGAGTDFSTPVWCSVAVALFYSPPKLVPDIHYTAAYLQHVRPAGNRENGAGV